MGADLVPASAGPERSLLMRVLRVLFGQRGPAPHESIAWDPVGRCSKAICSVCDREVGVSIKDRMAPHGPHRNPCPGGGGGTTVPRQGPGNAATSIRARNQALAGRARRRGKR